MRQSSLFSILLLVGFLLLGLFLLNLYLLQPRMALKLATPVPLPTIEEMPNPPHGEQVATTMSLIKNVASAKRKLPTRRIVHQRQVLRNPFIDSNVVNEKEHAKRSVANRERGDKESLPQVQMVMIGEFQNSALLDNALVKEGGTYKDFTILRIIESGVYIKNNDQVIKLPLGVYSTASVSHENDILEEKSKASSQSPSTKEKAALSELLHRLQPLLDGAGSNQEGNRKQHTNVSEGDGV